MFFFCYDGGGEWRNVPSVWSCALGFSRIALGSRVRLFSQLIWALPPLELSPVQTSM